MLDNGRVVGFLRARSAVPDPRRAARASTRSFSPSRVAPSACTCPRGQPGRADAMGFDSWDRPNRASRARLTLVAVVDEALGCLRGASPFASYGQAALVSRHEAPGCLLRRNLEPA